MTAEIAKVAKVDLEAKSVVLEISKPIEVQETNEAFSPTVSGGVQHKCGNCPRDYNI